MWCAEVGLLLLLLLLFGSGCFPPAFTREGEENATAALVGWARGTAAGAGMEAAVGPLPLSKVALSGVARRRCFSLSSCSRSACTSCRSSCSSVSRRLRSASRSPIFRPASSNDFLSANSRAWSFGLPPSRLSSSSKSSSLRFTAASRSSKLRIRSFVASNPRSLARSSCTSSNKAWVPALVVALSGLFSKASSVLKSSMTPPHAPHIANTNPGSFNGARRVLMD
mmetsp:Transcript_56539/g.106150  ORF Transcript_56539/g.106150 Transcript_56539/m.106150 type:complete len:225 (+) Transcript_56539:158-832(+)